MKCTMLIVTLWACLLAGCRREAEGPAPARPIAGKVPSFSLAWSEYPSWSVFGVASEQGIIDGREGELGPVENEWGVDIVLKEADYDTCLTLYGSSTVDAVCMTNMDSLAPCLGRDSVAVLPTSTSVGADACIVVGIGDLEALRGKPTHGLEKSVSQYAFERNLELQGKDPADFPFKNMDPAAAATAMQTGQEGIQSIMVWNPFVLQTLRTRDGAGVLFDSSTIPEEIIDMVVAGKDVLEKPGGGAFVCAVIDAFYQMCRRLGPALGEDPLDQTSARQLVSGLSDDQKEVLVALGAKFSNLPAEDMAIVVRQTRFYKTPDEALGLYEGQAFQEDTTPRVVDFCVSHGIVEKKPAVAFGDAAAQLNFDAGFIRKVKEKP